MFVSKTHSLCWRRGKGRKKTGLVLTLVGLGDVGGTALLALKLLGHEFSKIQIFDPNKAQCARYELELNQVLSPDGQPLPKVVICEEKTCLSATCLRLRPRAACPDWIRLCRTYAWRSTRPTGPWWARMPVWREASVLHGLFCQISDPVDHLSRSVFLQSNQNEAGEYDFSGLLPEQVQGFGLGVMAARCAYYARQLGVSEETLRVYGPHGQGLICANSCGPDYDATLSAELTEKTRTANLRVRELGFKPYLAPALSSAAVSILRLVREQEHFGAVPLGGAYFAAAAA